MNPGAFVISLDLESRWGMRDHLREGDGYLRNLEGERAAIEAMLKLFREYDIAATWGTVGLLFADGRAEAEAFAPKVKPQYREAALDAYSEKTGESEMEDPLHFAPSVIRAIADCPRQEIGSHTYSHFYTLEPGQTEESFVEDLRSAQRIATAKGYRLQSLIMPRNQVNLAYSDALKQTGFTVYRGNPASGLHGDAGHASRSLLRRATRLADTYVNVAGHQLFGWNDIVESSGLANVRASAFLRPYSPRRAALESLRLKRITAALDEAAKSKQLFHLWWHPHNFGIHLQENIALLKRVFDHYSQLRQSEGMQSLSMVGAADAARRA
jgi:peptidoglycan/xylan/chitin deacetylase (PgdA/CDA1 family)